MITTISINKAVRDTGYNEAKKLNLRGGFSEYVELLVKADLAGKKIKLKENEAK